MNRRGFIKLVSLSPLAMLLPKIKAEPEVVWEIPAGGVKRRSGTKYIGSLRDSENAWEEILREINRRPARNIYIDKFRQDNTWMWFQVSCLS